MQVKKAKHEDLQGEFGRKLAELAEKIDREQIRVNRLIQTGDDLKEQIDDFQFLSM